MKKTIHNNSGSVDWPRILEHESFLMEKLPMIPDKVMGRELEELQCPGKKVHPTGSHPRKAKQPSVYAV